MRVLALADVKEVKSEHVIQNASREEQSNVYAFVLRSFHITDINGATLRDQSKEAPVDLLRTQMPTLDALSTIFSNARRLRADGNHDCELDMRGRAFEEN